MGQRTERDKGIPKRLHDDIRKVTVINKGGTEGVSPLHSVCRTREISLLYDH